MSNEPPTFRYFDNLLYLMSHSCQQYLGNCGPLSVIISLVRGVLFCFVICIERTMAVQMGPPAGGCKCWDMTLC